MKLFYKYFMIEVIKSKLHLWVMFLKPTFYLIIFDS